MIPRLTSGSTPRRLRLTAPRRPLRAGLAAAVLLLTATATADGLRPLPCALTAHEGRLQATLDLSAVFPSTLRKQLSNGLTNQIALHVLLLPERGQPPAAIFGREIDVLYDVWDETYGVTVRDPSSPRGRRQRFASYEALSAFLSDGRAIDLGPVAALGAGSWSIQARIEFNPVSKELLERTRELIASPSATGRSGTPSRSVLGTMASYLLRGTDPGTTVQLSRSAPFSARDVAIR